MPTSPDLSLIVPAYDEERSIAATLDAIVSYLDAAPLGFEVIVAADGADATRERALEKARTDPRISVSASLQRRGKGRAIRESVALARGRLVGYIDADGKVPADEVVRLLPLFAEGWDVVVGSRALPGSRIEGRRPLHRRLGSALFVALLRLLGIDGARDTQCGLKLFRADVARDLFARQRIDGYMFDVELLMLARAAGYRVREVPIRWRSEGDSRLDPIKGSWQILADLFRIRASLR
jgi:dolichyl-phosphate beta-glucosyltransferase